MKNRIEDVASRLGIWLWLSALWLWMLSMFQICERHTVCTEYQSGIVWSLESGVWTLDSGLWSSVYSAYGSSHAPDRGTRYLVLVPGSSTTYQERQNELDERKEMNAVTSGTKTVVVRTKPSTGALGTPFFFNHATNDNATTGEEPMKRTKKHQKSFKKGSTVGYLFSYYA
jgi:hypothetical protein